MCNIEDIATRIAEIEKVLAGVEQRQKDILRAIPQLEKQESATIGDVAVILRAQAKNNLETSKLLNDLSTELTGLSFEVQELKRWKQVMSGSTADWISEHRAEQSKMAFRAIRDGFNENELLTLVMELGINQADVSGDSVSEKALWLVEYCRRTGIFWTLIREGKKLRPMALWPVETASFR